MSRAALVLPLALGLLLALPRAAAGSTPWRRPVAGPVVRAFAFRPAARFAPGWHRGVTFAAPPGTAVGAACGGVVTWAGTVGTSGRGVAVACGPLSATYTHLGATAVRRGRAVVPGETVGWVGPAGTVQLGARVRARRDGYLDPLRLLGGASPPLGPAPPPGRWRPRLPRGRPPAAAPAPAPAAAPAPPLLGAWLPVGLALLVAAAGIGAVRAAPARVRAALAAPARRAARAVRSW
jgi:Peptidase family M23